MMSAVAVIGGGVAGLTAAGLLGKRGRRVVLFERDARLGGKAGTWRSPDGLQFDLGPTLLTMPHLVQGVFDELGARMPKLTRLGIHCRYHYPNGSTFDACDDADATYASADALAAGEGERLAGFYRHAADIYHYAGEPFLAAPFDGLGSFFRRLSRDKGWRAAWVGAKLGTLHSLATRNLQSQELRQFVGRFATYVGASPFRASAAFAMIPHIERAFGVHHPQGGMGGLAQALAEAVSRQGVEFRLNESVTWRHDGRGFVVRSNSGEERFSQLIINSDPTRTDTGTELSLSAVVFMLRVPRRLQLPHHTIVFGGDYPGEFRSLFSGEMPADPTLYLCHPVATDATMAQADATALYVMVNAPAWPYTEPFPTAALGERVLARLQPWIGADAEILNQRTPSDFARMGSPGGALYGAVGHGRLGPFRRPRMRGELPGQFFAGGGTHPGGGVPMVALSGRFAAELAMQQLETS